MRIKQIHYFLAAAVSVSLLFLSGCSVSEAPLSASSNFGSVAPENIYIPEYYIYRNGRYKFVKGHYRKIRNRKAFRKKSLEGYGSKGDYRAAR